RRLWRWHNSWLTGNRPLRPSFDSSWNVALACDCRRLLPMAEFTRRNGLHFSPALPLDHVHTRAFVDHGFGHHVDLSDIDGLVDDLGVIDTDCPGTQGFQHSAAFHEYERMRRKRRLVIHRAQAHADRYGWSQRRPADVTATFPPANPGRRPLR